MTDLSDAERDTTFDAAESAPHTGAWIFGVLGAIFALAFVLAFAKKIEIVDQLADRADESATFNDYLATGADSAIWMVCALIAWGTGAIVQQLGHLQRD